MDIENVADWVLRKIGLPDNRIANFRHLSDKLSVSRLLVVFISRKKEAEQEFLMYLQAARQLLKLADVEFAYAYIEDLTEFPGLNTITNSRIYRSSKFQIRVFRRGHLSDFRDFKYPNKDLTSKDIEQFIFRSTFVGDGPDLIRSISTDNMMKLFTQDIPALFLFYNDLD